MFLLTDEFLRKTSSIFRQFVLVSSKSLFILRMICLHDVLFTFIYTMFRFTGEFLGKTRSIFQQFVLAASQSISAAHLRTISLPSFRLTRYFVIDCETFLLRTSRRGRFILEPFQSKRLAVSPPIISSSKRFARCWTVSAWARPFRPRNVLKSFRPGRFVSEPFQTRPFRLRAVSGPSVYFLNRFAPNLFILEL